MISRRKLMRNRLLRAFQCWYRENESKLPFHFYISHASKDRLILRIKDVTPVIFIRLGNNEMDVWAQTDEYCDILEMVFCKPVRDGNVYKDTSLTKEYSHLRYQSRASVWEEELFVDCANFIKGYILPAERLRFYTFNDADIYCAALEKIQGKDTDLGSVLISDIAVHINK